MQDTKKTLQNQACLKVFEPFNFDFNSLNTGERFTLHYLLMHFIRRGHPLTQFKQVSKKHYELGIARTIELQTNRKSNKFSNYNKFLKSLICKGIIERPGSYSVTSKICKAVRFTEQFVRVSSNLDVIKKAKKQRRVRKNNKLESKADTYIRKLNLVKGLDIESTINNLITDDYVKGNFICDNWSSHTKNSVNLCVKNGKLLDIPITTQLAQDTAKKENLCIIYHKKERLLILTSSSYQDFIETKKKELRLVYKALLLMVEQKDYFPSTISDSNNRLTSFFTVFPNKLLQYLEISKSPILTVDIANSQFVFLANIIKCYDLFLTTGYKNPLYYKIEAETEYFDTFKASFEKLRENGNFASDVQNFLGAAIDGTLYENIVSLVNERKARTDQPIKRSSAKVGMFIVAFASYRYSHQLKTDIKEVYPNVIDFIDTFKKAKPNKDKQGFAVWLQRIESSVCVVEVLSKLQKKYLTLTRHDSFSTQLKTPYENEQFKLDVDERLKQFLLFGYELRTETYS